MPTREPAKRNIDHELLMGVKRLPKTKKSMPLEERESVNRDVYYGYIRLSDGTRKRVAIKEMARDGLFVDIIWRLLEKRKIKPNLELVANEYNETIRELVNAGIDLPKTKAIVHEGKVLLISQFFGNAKERKLTKLFQISRLTPKELDEYVTLFAKIINIGYVPDFSVIEKLSSGGFVPLDIDYIVLNRLKQRVYGKDAVYGDLSDSFSNFATFKDYFTTSRFHKAVLSKLESEELKAMWQKIFSDYYRFGHVF